MIFFNKSLTHMRPLNPLKCNDNSIDDKVQREKPRKMRKPRKKIKQEKKRKKLKENLKHCNKNTKRRRKVF